MDEQQLQQQIVQLVQAAMQGDQQATQQIQQIMQAAQLGNQQAAQIALMIQQVAQQMQQQQVQAARFGAKLNYIKQLKGQCPEGYKMEYYKEGGQLCKKCMKVQQDGGEVKQTPNTVAGQFKMEAAKCGKKMKKKEAGGAIESEKCGGKPRLKKKACGGPVKKNACGSKIESDKCGGKPKLKKKACGGPVKKKVKAREGAKAPEATKAYKGGTYTEDNSKYGKFTTVTAPRNFFKTSRKIIQAVTPNPYSLENDTAYWELPDYAPIPGLDVVLATGRVEHFPADETRFTNRTTGQTIPAKSVREASPDYERLNRRFNSAKSVSKKK